ncbi:hypothetical protein NECAME_16600 [Necator americanus]|uniref:Uncharacterized protein n=1 Tax=Necator americanus TaxID=51031 RepID=W2TUV7_NECAM|nr:hypothetical protein NECAME_16600 [Necator americanus]ETN85885.1 hypothetical protein NECAME_16600 [Necator americanus]
MLHDKRAVRAQNHRSPMDAQPTVCAVNCGISRTQFLLPTLPNKFDPSFCPQKDEKLGWPPVLRNNQPRIHHDLLNGTLLPMYYIWQSQLIRNKAAIFGKRAPMDRSSMVRFGKRALMDRSSMVRWELTVHIALCSYMSIRLLIEDRKTCKPKKPRTPFFTLSHDRNIIIRGER